MACISGFPWRRLGSGGFGHKKSHLQAYLQEGRELAVIEVAHRLVPEGILPCGITDSLGGLKYFYEKGAEKFNISTGRISVGGVSTGGFISLALRCMARDAGLPLRLVAVGTPVVDDISQYQTANDPTFPSMKENEHAPTLGWRRLHWFD